MIQATGRCDTDVFAHLWDSCLFPGAWQYHFWMPRKEKQWKKLKQTDYCDRMEQACFACFFSSRRASNGPRCGLWLRGSELWGAVLRYWCRSRYQSLLGNCAYLTIAVRNGWKWHILQNGMGPLMVLACFGETICHIKSHCYNYMIMFDHVRIISRDSIHVIPSN